MIHLGYVREGKPVNVSKDDKGYRVHYDSRYFKKRKRAVKHGLKIIIRSYFPDASIIVIDDFLDNNLIDTSQLEV